MISRRAVAVWLAFRKRDIGDLEFYLSNDVELRLQVDFGLVISRRVIGDFLLLFHVFAASL